MMALESITVQQISEIVKMAAVLVGGFWAAWTFHKLQKVRASELENRQKQTTIQKTRVEHKEARIRLLRQQPQLAIELQVSETVASVANYKSFLSVTVVLKNDGEQNLNLTFGPSPLTVGRILFQNDGKQTFDVQRFGASLFVDSASEPGPFRERILRVGQKRQMALTVIPVTQPAAYILQFQADYAKRPFDDERSSEPAMVVNAIEQTIYFATANSESGAKMA
jgi:hypothetical protein